MIDIWWRYQLLQLLCNWHLTESGMS